MPSHAPAPSTLLEHPLQLCRSVCRSQSVGIAENVIRVEALGGQFRPTMQRTLQHCLGQSQRQVGTRDEPAGVTPAITLQLSIILSLLVVLLARDEQDKFSHLFVYFT